MKVKRLVSVLLAALLLVGMIPMNAMAEVVPWPDTTANANDRTQISVMVSKNMPDTKVQYETVRATATEDELKANIKLANEAWNDNTGSDGKYVAPGTSVEVNQGDTVWVGFKATLVSPQKYTGILAYTLYVKFNSDVFAPTGLEYADDDYMEYREIYDGSASYSTDNFLNTVILNDGTNGMANQRYSGNGINYDYIKKYKGSGKYGDSTMVQGNGNTMVIQLSNTSTAPTAAFTTAEAATWDVVVPLYVKTDAPGGAAKIEVLTVDASNSPTNVQLSTITLNGSNKLTDGDGSTIFGSESDTKDYISIANDITVTVKSTNAEIETVAGATTVAAGDTTIKVKLNEYAEAGSKVNDKDNGWEVYGGTDGDQQATVTAVSGPDSNGVITLTVQGLQAGQVKVVAKAGALKKKGGADTEADFTLTGITAANAPAAPTVTASDTDGDTVVTVPAGTWYKLGNGDWTPAGDSGTQLTAAQLKAAMTGTPTSEDGVDTYTGVFAVAADAAGTIKTDVPLKRYTAPKIAAGALGTNDASVDFETATLHVKDGWTASLGSEGTTLTPAASTLTVSKAASGEIFGVSKSETLPTPTTHGDVTVTQSTAEAGTSTFGTGFASGDKYAVNQSDSTAPTTFDQTANPAAATVEDWIWVVTPGKNGATIAASAWQTAPAKVQGTGWNYSKVGPKTINLSEGATQDITLTKTGPIAWADSVSENDFEISPTGLTITGFDKATGKLSLSGEPTKGGTYTLTVKASAIQGGALNSKTGSNETITLVGPSDNALGIKVVDASGKQYTVDKATVSAGATETITVTLDKGQSVKTVDCEDDRLTATVEDGKIKVVVDPGVTGKPEDNMVTLTITVGYTTPALEETEIPDAAIEQGEDVTVSVTNFADMGEVTVESSDEDVVTVSYDKDTGKITVTGGTKGGTATITVKHGDEETTFDVTVLAEVTDVKVGTPSVKEGTIDSVAEQVANTEVTVTVDGDKTVKKKLGDLIDKETIAEEIKEALQAKADEEAAKAVEEEAKAAYDKAVEDGETTDAYEDWIKTATKDDGGDTWEDLINNAAAPEVTTVPTGELDLSAIADMIDSDVIDAMIAADQDNFADTKTADDVTIDADSLKSINVTKKSSGTPSSGPNVNLETNGWATPDGPVELDESGKITKLPGVIGQKLGTVFKGWATQAGNANTIVKEGREITGDTTLYGIFEGYMNGDYNANNQRTARPGDPVTRGELLTMLVRAAGIYDDSVDYNTTFADAKGAWYTSYVGCAEEAGILAGDKEGTARPKDNITREEAAIFIAKTFNVTIPEGGTTEYVVDFDDTSSWAKDYVAALVNNGTAVGNDKQEYEPKKNITRAEVAAMINKYIGLTQTKKTALSGSASSPFVDVQNKNSWFYAEMIFASLNAPENYYVTEVTYPSR